MRYRILLLFFAILSLLLTALLVNAQQNPPAGMQDTVWLIHGDRRITLGDNYFQTGPGHSIVGVIIVPEPVEAAVVSAAWTYAFQYGADGLDLPNYQRAIEIVRERHPTWQAYLTNGYQIIYGQVDSSLDTQDPTLTPMPEITANP